jgi:hypothetical protein
LLRLLGLNGDGWAFATIMNKTRTTSLVFVTISALGGSLFLWGWVMNEKYSREIRPWITYKRLLYIAEECDKYKESHSAWPSSLTELWALHPEMLDPWSKDAWGRNILLVPYNHAVGYGEILSYARDGRPGGIGEDRDLEVRFPTKANEAWNMEMGVGLKQPERAP